MTATRLPAVLLIAATANVAAQFPAAPPPAPTPAFAVVAADRPDAPVSVFTALQEQLGLTLESRKGRMDVLVIDQVEMPTPN
jgi:uncharacterized protein (TIGR03435 family)